MEQSITRAQLDSYNRVRAEFLAEHMTGWTDFLIDGDVLLVHLGGSKEPKNLIIAQDGAVRENI